MSKNSKNVGISNIFLFNYKTKVDLNVNHFETFELNLEFKP